MRRWPQFMRDRSDSRFSQCGCSSLAGHFPASAIRRRRNRPPFASDGSGLGNQVFPFIVVRGEASRRIGVSRRRYSACHAASAWADDFSLDGAGERAARRAHVPAFPGKPPTRVERIFTGDSAYVPSNGAWRSMYYSSEPRIEIIKAAAIRANCCRMGCQKLAGQAIDDEAASLQSNSNTAEARIWTSDFSGIPLKSKVHLGNGAGITHTFRRGDIQSPAGPASLSELRELRWIEAA
jgi:hypothetical protein